jgi:hypothetical protein
MKNNFKFIFIKIKFRFRMILIFYGGLKKNIWVPEVRAGWGWLGRGIFMDVLQWYKCMLEMRDCMGSFPSRSIYFPFVITKNMNFLIARLV